MFTVLVNPTAGGGGPQRADDIASAFAAAGVEPRIVTLRPDDEVTAIAREAARTSTVVVAAGGDGTVNAVAAGLRGTAAALGVLPAGTLNHFARDLKLPADLAEAVSTVVTGQARQVDAADVNGHLFVNNSSIGVYPNAVEIRERLRRAGHWKWVAMLIATWRVLRTYRGLHVRLTANGRQFSTRTPFVFVGNNEYVTEGLHVGAREHLTTGQLFVYLAPSIPTRRLPLVVLRALLGRGQGPGTFDIIQTGDLVVECSGARAIAVSLDGETRMLGMPLHYQSLPGALRVIG